nr:hypothetical protein [Tanacetum cinerariifolium]
GSGSPHQTIIHLLIDSLICYTGCRTAGLRDLQLEDAKAVDCLSNASIFEQLTLIGRVKKLEKKQRSGSHKLKRLYKVGLTARVESSDDNEDLGEDASKKLQKEEQQQLNDEENDTLFMKLLEKRRKFFAVKRAEEKRNKPPTQAQERKIMYTCLKNVEGEKLIDLKNKSFDSILKMFDRAFKRVNTFVDFRTELVEESSKKAEAKAMEQESLKRAGTKIEQESYKKQKIDDDKDTSKLKQEDVESLWKLVKAKHGSTRPEGDYERVLWGDLKVMFEPHVKDDVWKMQ